MGPFRTPAEHYANPPSTWQVVQVGEQQWDLITASRRRIAVSYRTQPEAEAQKSAGRWFDHYERLGRWFAAQQIPGRAPYRVRLPPAPPTIERPAPYTGSSRDMDSMTRYLEDVRRCDAASASTRADQLIADGAAHTAVMMALGSAEHHALDTDRPAYAARTDAYATAYGLRGWYRYLCDYGDPARRHRVQVNFLRTYADGDRGRFNINPPSPVASPDRFFTVVDRDTGKVAFQTQHRETADAWVEANESGRVLIDLHGDAFCLCANDITDEGFEYVEQDGTFTGSNGSFEYLVCLNCRRHFRADTGDVLGEIDQVAFLAGMRALYPDSPPE